MLPIWFKIHWHQMVQSTTKMITTPQTPILQVLLLTKELASRCHGTGMFADMSHKSNMGYWCIIWYGKCSFDVWFFHILPTSYYRWMVWDMDSWFMSWFFFKTTFQHRITIHKIHQFHGSTEVRCERDISMLLDDHCWSPIWWNAWPLSTVLIFRTPVTVVTFCLEWCWFTKQISLMPMLAKWFDVLLVLDAPF